MGVLSLFGCADQSRKHSMDKTSELDTISFENLSKKAYEYLNKQQDICTNVYKIGGYQDWYYDQFTGELTFSDKGIKKFIIDYEEVGSLSLKSNTWLWAWENPNLEEKIKSKIGLVRDYGQRRQFEKLINPKWTADQFDGWEMTAIAAYLMKAKGAYRVPSKDSLLYSFMIYKTIRWVDSTKIK
ncbi:MAG: hypothetical protein JWR61_4218 [Ferruginibacter sp.]|nr:hypothetical protein [Ferruginibacter sp.]